MKRPEHEWHCLPVVITLERAERELQAARERLAAVWGSTRPLYERVEGALERIAPIPLAEHLARRITQNPDIARADWA